ncbi:sugar O-acetyltransferase [Lactococcus lactis]|nr:sugar O-acetyltransferase [Lactococcus lactis]MDG4990275.1 sugar O-acetyltransferase [Lactococcus lactis]
MNNEEKMLSGKMYDAGHHSLAPMRARAHKLSKLYSDSFEDEVEKRTVLIEKLFPNRNGSSFFQGPIFVEYGFNISLGKNFYANYNFCALDNAEIKIGNDVMIGMNGTLATSVHPLRWQDRNMTVRDDGTLYAPEYTRPITIEDNCWLASNVTVIGGVTIGEGCVIGAGSVVTKDIPANTFAAGVPCKVIKEITEDDAINLKKELW